MIIRYKRLEKKNESIDDHVARFIDGFLTGYQEVTIIENWWLKAMSKLISYRRPPDYYFLHQHHDWKTVNSKLKVDLARYERRD